MDTWDRKECFDEIGPNYSVLNDKTKIMSDLYTSYNHKFADINIFHCFFHLQYIL